MKSILTDRQKEWTGAERRGAFLWLPLSVFGLAGEAIRVRISEEKDEEHDAEEKDSEDAAAEEEEEEEGEASEEAESETESEAPEPPPKKAKTLKPKTLSYPQAARNLFQHAEVKQMLRAVLGDKMQEVNIKACEKVEELERQEAEARLAKARAIPFDVGRIRLVESTPEAVESTPVESTSEFDWVESTSLGCIV